ncbi:1728_t:CDS:2 [Cetraspora pellucida]|uniref:1728_t:CDS:1 n=1 Tax=Cetraspora pellucida TaxID=1433469 RepID=A0A9N9ENC2_9GLOM|nr:1728_t:CDS:2 [Cetraspora pellucida]
MRNTERDLRKRTTSIPITDTLVDPQKTNTQRSSRISRIINSFKWVILAGWIFWYFEVDSGVQEILTLGGNTPPPKYSAWKNDAWKNDEMLGKFIPIATIMGTIGIMGMIVDFWSVWGFFRAPIIVLGLLRGVVAFLEILEIF